MTAPSVTIFRGARPQVTLSSNVGGSGPIGSSAYEVAVANGFVGSEAAWLASLEGPPGADGLGVLEEELYDTQYQLVEVDPQRRVSRAIRLTGQQYIPSLEVDRLVIAEEQTGDGALTIAPHQFEVRAEYDEQFTAVEVDRDRNLSRAILASGAQYIPQLQVDSIQINESQTGAGGVDAASVPQTGANTIQDDPDFGSAVVAAEVDEDGNLARRVTSDGTNYLPKLEADSLVLDRVSQQEAMLGQAVPLVDSVIYGAKSASGDHEIRRAFATPGADRDIPLASLPGRQFVSARLTSDDKPTISYIGSTAEGLHPHTMDPFGDGAGRVVSSRDIMFRGDSMTQALAAAHARTDGEPESFTNRIGPDRLAAFDGIGGTTAMEIAGRQGVFSAKSYTPTTATTLSSELSIPAGGNYRRFNIQLANAEWLPLYGNHMALLNDTVDRLVVEIYRRGDGSYGCMVPRATSGTVSIASGASVTAIYSRGAFASATLTPGVPNDMVAAGADAVWPMVTAYSARVRIYASGVSAPIEGVLYIAPGSSDPPRFIPASITAPVVLPSSLTVLIEWLDQPATATWPEQNKARTHLSRGNDLINIFWLGRNGSDATFTRPITPYTLSFSEIYSGAIQKLTARNKKFLIVPIFNALDFRNPSVNYSNDMASNAEIQAAFPDNYYDFRSEFITGAEAWLLANYPSVHAQTWNKTFFIIGTGPLGSRPASANDGDIWRDSDNGNARSIYQTSTSSWVSYEAPLYTIPVNAYTIAGTSVGDTAADTVQRVFRAGNTHMNWVGNDRMLDLIAARINTLGW